MRFLFIGSRRARTYAFLGVSALLCGGIAPASVAHPFYSAPAQQPAAQTGNTRTLGTIQSIAGNKITLLTQAGATLSVEIQENARILRVEPGEKDLKNATPIQLKDLVAGDRILVVGKASEDGKSLTAAAIVAMKKADIEAKQKQDEEDWQKRGIGGLVTAVDPTAGTLTISVASFAGTKDVSIQTTKDTVIRRYAPDSVKFDEAKLSTLSQIKPGDQLRARGTRSADGASFGADEIVSGSFRNISGTILSLDPSANSMTVMDLATKKPVTVKISTGSEVRKLPVMMAQFIAVRMRGSEGGAGGNASPAQRPGEQSAQSNTNSSGETARPANSEGQRGPGEGGRFVRRGGAPDFQQILTRLPPASLSDFQKGDAVMIVSTEGNDSGSVTAITVLGGVEPILAAAPKGGQPMTLSPWSLGGGGEAEAAGGDAGPNQ